ncbi:response regulator [Aliikangiella sp. IMCC44359]|uniref:response regulator n=1 Tax=Aliikangiella sp. IMCC44359 TaxID=3459125 RepID=UPI00403A7DFF
MNNDFNIQLSKISADFQKEIPNRLLEIESAFNRVNIDNWQENNESELFALLHKLSGTSGTLGWQPLSDATSKLMQQLKQIVEFDTPKLAEWNLIGIAIKDLEQIAEMREVEPADELECEYPDSEKKLVFIVDDDETLTNLLACSLESNGYTAEQFSTPEAFADACRQNQSPDLVLMDMDFPGGAFAGGEILAQLRHELDKHLPSIFISKHDSMQARLTAFRAGASRYLLKPINIEQLNRLTDELCAPCGEDPYRVIVVDDDEYTLQAFVIALEAAGMVVEGINHPLDVLDRVREFMPDVLLLDVYMPEASGPEIAAVLREDEELSWLPILFLSVETDPSTHALALAHGGDDFLIKPIPPNYLQEAVKARAWRARRNRRLFLASNAQ